MITLWSTCASGGDHCMSFSTDSECNILITALLISSSYWPTNVHMIIMADFFFLSFFLFWRAAILQGRWNPRAEGENVLNKYYLLYNTAPASTNKLICIFLSDIFLFQNKCRVIITMGPNTFTNSNQIILQLLCQLICCTYIFSNMNNISFFLCMWISLFNHYGIM